LLTRRTLGLVT